jgi:hypothetical protein
MDAGLDDRSDRTGPGDDDEGMMMGMMMRG